MYSSLRTAVVRARNHSASSNPTGSNHEQHLRDDSGRLTRSRTNLIATLANPYVEHDVANSEFIINIGKDKAFIAYKLDGGVMHMEHTDVPYAFEGRGVGKQLAKVNCLFRFFVIVDSLRFILWFCFSVRL